MADLISVSANEIRSTVLKACVGCRVERGVASEIADAVALVGSHGIDLSSDLVGALDAFPEAAVKAPTKSAGTLNIQDISNDFYSQDENMAEVY